VSLEVSAKSVLHSGCSNNPSSIDSILAEMCW